MATMTVLCVVASSTVAMADTLVADGDGLAPLVSNATVAFGTLECQGAAPAKNVLFAIKKAGGGREYADGASVTVSPGTPSSSAVSATAAGTINLPSDWTDVRNSTLSTSTASSTITLDPSGLSAGSFVATVRFDATGSSSEGDSLTLSVDVTVTATIQSCNTAPTLTLPTEITAEAVSADGAVVTYSVGADDEQDGPLSAVCSPASGSVFPLGTTTVHCSVTDSAGVEATGTFDVTVKDTGAPVLALPGNMTAEATGPSGATVTFGGSASDLVDPDVPVVCTPASGSTFPLGTTTVECSATDAHDNTASGSFTVTVVDTTPPALTLPADIVGIEATGPAGADLSFEASAEDLVDGNVPVVCNPASGSTFPLGTTTVNCSAADARGNTANGSFTVTVVDTTDPTITFVSRTAANVHGWNDGDVVVEWSCSDLVGVIDTSIVVTVLAEGAGKEATGTCEDTSGNTASDTQIDINIDKTAPTITGAPDRPANGNGWYDADVTVSFECDDTLSGVADCTVSSVLGEGAGQSVGGSVTDKAGNSATTSVEGINIDETAPSIAAALDRLPAGTGWFNASTGAPIVSFTCSDTLSGLDGACPGDHLFGEGADQEYGQTVFDLAGNSASAGVSNVDVDTLAPSIGAVLDRSVDASGWFNEVTGAPIVMFTCSDPTSGIASCPADHTFADGEGQAHAGTATDVAGNSATAGVSGVDVDLTDPTLAWSAASPASGDAYYFGFVPPAPTCTAADALSGEDGCAVAGYGDGVGAHTMSATAKDVAGNSFSEARTYSVLAWTLKGFYQPVDMPTATSLVYNTVRNGSTVPLKFEVFAGPAELTDTAAVKSLTYAQTSCDATAITDAIETVATGGTVLRYDSTAGQYIYNWKTPSAAGKCYVVTMTTQDGSFLKAYFKLK